MMMLAAAAAALTLACTCTKPEGPVPSKEFTASKYSGYFVEELAKAYETFLETDALPASATVEGIQYSKAQYIAAGFRLLKMIQENPEHWEEEEVDVPVKITWGGSEANNTFEQDSISLEALTWVADRVIPYFEKNSAIPNYCNFGTIVCPARGADSTYTYSYDKPFKDGVNYIGKFIARDFGAALCRMFHYYKHNSEFPDKVSTWGTDFLHKANWCPIDDPVVLAEMEKAIAGKTTQREKAEAIFRWARDEWEWENYSNTKKGAVKTIQAKGGNCCDLTHATVAMCRAAGIPARYMHGQCYFASGVIGHVIPEIWADGRWWVADPSNNTSTFSTPVWKGMETFNGRYRELPF